MSSKKAAVYFSAGIGDALLLIPLIKILKKDGYQVFGIFTSPFQVHELFESNEVLDEKIVVLNQPRKIWFTGKYFFNKFDLSIVNYFAASKSNLLMASKTSLKVNTNRNVFFKRIKLKNIELKEPKINIHDAEQNINLYSENHQLTESDFTLTSNKSFSNHFKNKIAIQIGAGNNKTPFKIWSSDKWIQLMEKICSDYPDTQLLLIGDKHEGLLVKHLNHKNVTNLIGKTTLNELPSIISDSTCFIGSDSGIMHLAVALGLPTFTIWGASSELLYGYHNLNAVKHQVVFNESVNCRPCNAWINPNISRVKDVNQCPDFKCIAEIEVKDIYSKLKLFLSHHLQN